MIYLATILMKKGEGVDALAFAERACEIAEKVGMKRVASDAHAILEQLK